jgi:hypothetical protein
VLISSTIVDPVPVRPDPSPIKLEAATAPVYLAFPFTYKVVPDAPTDPTSSLNLGIVVPTPTLSFTMSTNILLRETKSALCLVFPILDIF